MNIPQNVAREFFNRYCVQNMSSSNSRVYANTFTRYNALNYSDEFDKIHTEVKQLHEMSLFEEGLERLIKDTTEYNDLMTWIKRDPAAYKVYQQYKIIKVLGE